MWISKKWIWLYQRVSVNWQKVSLIRAKSECEWGKSEFDWNKKEINGFYKDRVIDVKLEEDILTRILLQIEIMHQKQRNRLKESYLIIDRDEIKEIDISTSNSGKKISVPFGSYDVIEVSHRSKGSNRINIFWLAPDLDFIPIRLEQTEDNKVNFEANLVQLIR